MLKNSENQYYKESQQNQLHHYRTHYSKIKIPISRLLLKGLLYCMGISLYFEEWTCFG